MTRLLEKARQQGTADGGAAAGAAAAGEPVRACALRTRGSARTGPGGIDVAELLASSGAAELVEIVDIDGVLHVLVCGGGRVRQFTAGRTADAVRAADFARFALRRLARARPGDDPGSALAILAASGPRLQHALLGPAAAVPERRARRHRPAGPAARHPVDADPRAGRPGGQRRPVRRAPGCGPGRPGRPPTGASPSPAGPAWSPTAPR